jgi:hypothetical protein
MRTGKKITKKKSKTDETGLIEKKVQKVSPSTGIKFTERDGQKNEVNCRVKSEEQYMEVCTQAFGTPDFDSQELILNEIAKTFCGIYTSGGEINSSVTSVLNQIVEIMYDIKPQNAIERMLLSQMIGVHQSVMKALRNAVYSDQTSYGVDLNTNRATKLMRAFTNQMQALKQFRSNGQQKMTVEHVHVHSGGQAMVGQVRSEGGGVSEEK